MVLRCTTITCKRSCGRQGGGPMIRDWRCQVTIPRCAQDAAMNPTNALPTDVMDDLPMEAGANGDPIPQQALAKVARPALTTAGTAAANTRASVAAGKAEAKAAFGDKPPSLYDRIEA